MMFKVIFNVNVLSFVLRFFKSYIGCILGKCNFNEIKSGVFFY